MGHGSTQQRLDLTGVTPDNIRMHLCQNLLPGGSPKIRAAHAYGIKNHRLSLTFGGYSCQKQGFDFPGTGGSQIQYQTVTGGGHLRGLLRVLCHNGRGTAGQRQIGTVVGGDQIHHAVKQGTGFSGLRE